MDRSSNPRTEDEKTRSYDSIAHNYDQLIVPHFSDQPGKDLAALLDLPRGSTALDVGTGTGSAALQALKNVGSEGTVVALDPSLKIVNGASILTVGTSPDHS